MEILIGNNKQHKVYQFNRHIQREDFVNIVTDILKAHDEWDTYKDCFEEEVFAPLREKFPEEPDYSECDNAEDEDDLMEITIDIEMKFFDEITSFLKKAYGEKDTHLIEYMFTDIPCDYIDPYDIKHKGGINCEYLSVRIDNTSCIDTVNPLDYNERYNDYDNKWWSKDPLETFREMFFEFLNKSMHLDAGFINSFLDKWMEFFKPSEGFETSFGELIAAFKLLHEYDEASDHEYYSDMLYDFYPELNTFDIEIDVLDGDVVISDWWDIGLTSKNRWEI